MGTSNQKALAPLAPMRKIQKEQSLIENPLPALLLVLLSIFCWLSASWGHVKCTRGMRSGQCVFNHANPAKHIWGGEWMSFELGQLIDATVADYPSQNSSPLAVLSSTFMSQPAELCLMRVASGAVRLGGEQVDKDAEHRVPLLVDGSISPSEQCSTLTRFAAGKGGRSIIIGGSFVTLPRLLAALCLLAALLLGSPTKCRSAANAVVTWFRSPWGRRRRRQHNDDDDEFEWNKERVAALVKHAAAFPKGTRGRWVEISALVDPACTPYLAETKFKSIDLAARKHLAETKKKAQARLTEAARKNLDPTTATTKEVAPKPEREITAKTNAPVSEWTREEQKGLEWALKQVGKEEFERWDKIAALVPSRTKKEVIKRCKEIVKKVRNN